MITVKIYSKDNIHKLPWDQTKNGAAQRKILKEFITEGPKHFISNAHTTMQALLVGDKVLPITISESPNGSSYVCSPFTHYITYGKEEMGELKNPLLKGFLLSSLKLLGNCLSFCKIDKNVFVNNWLMPTNLHFDLTEEEINSITKALIKEYPDHAILFRSINTYHPNKFSENLQKAKYHLVPSREIYFTNPQEESVFKSRMFKSDQKVLNSTSYHIIDDQEKLRLANPRIRELYNLLNIQKYSKCNPQYTEAFIDLVQTSGWMTFRGFEKEGNIDAVFGYFSQENMMTSPFFGYDTSRPGKDNLYRLIATKLLLEAQEKDFLLHQSAGAGHYKKLRRAKAFPEFTAVYSEHLKPLRRLGWKGLEKILDTFSERFMSRKD